jgi:nucleoside-diphosphate-sugar epimerase/predicted HD phosphohydrolase
MRVAVIGSAGRIGTVVREALGSEMEIVAIDRDARGGDRAPAPVEIDAMGGASRIPPTVAPRVPAERLAGCDAVVHLGWIAAMGPATLRESYGDRLPSDARHLANLDLAESVLRAAGDAGVRRVVLASSVQADAYREWVGPGLLRADRVPRAVGPYGAAKVLVEEVGRHYAERGLDVTCIRLGAVTADGLPDREDLWERRVWLSRRDCARALRACLEAPAEPGRFRVFYAVSNNEGRVHETYNPFGWEPIDRATLSEGGPHGEPSAGGLVRFTRLDEGTAEDFALSKACALEHNSGFADRMLGLLRVLVTLPSRYRVDRLQHGLQTATRALRDGADEETVVCALLHDVAVTFSSENHAAVVAEMLRPYISEENRWMLAYHGEFQKRHMQDRSDEERNARERYREHPCFERTARFCDDWDQRAFDPAYDTLPLETFEPMVRRILSREPGSAARR